ncbi:MAG: hypothetical protein AAFX46_11505, partial [Cyanobacteria bacterium J06636_27]
KKANPLKRIIRDFQENKKESQKLQLPQPQSSRHLLISNKTKPRKSFLGGMMNALGLCVLLLSAGWLTYYFLSGKIKNSIETATLKYEVPNESNIKSSKPADITKNQLKTPVVNNSQATSKNLEDDIFYTAVRIANQAVEDRKTANTSEKWLDVAEKWQYASDLMAEVPSTHSRFKEAQSRIQLYKEYSDLAKEKANNK